MKNRPCLRIIVLGILPTLSPYVRDVINEFPPLLTGFLDPRSTADRDQLLQVSRARRSVTPVQRRR